MLSWKQRCSNFDIHSNTHSFHDQLFKEMLILFTLLLIEIAINPHIKTSIGPTCYSKISRNYQMSGCHGNCFNELYRGNFAIFVLLLSNQFQYGVNFLNICNDRDYNDVSKHKH